MINLLRQVKVDLTGYDFSGLTICQAYLQGANLHDCSLVDADIHKSVFSQAIANTLCVEFSPDGKLLATSDANGRVDLWNIENTEMQTIETRHVLSLKAHNGWAWAARFSPDGKTLVSCGDSDGIKLLLYMYSREQRTGNREQACKSRGVGIFSLVHVLIYLATAIFEVNGLH